MDVRTSEDTLQSEKDLVTLGFRSLPVAILLCCCGGDGRSNGFCYQTELVPKTFDSLPVLVVKRPLQALEVGRNVELFCAWR